MTTKIDEDTFKPLFKEGRMGHSNASVRVLVSMSILKEGRGYSDEELFESVEFDLLTRKALGLEMFDDVPPSLDTYYLFLRRICDYEARTGIDLMKECFEQVAGEQVKMMKISGRSIRMDSKPIGSNIARCSRYELVHRTLVKFLRVKDHTTLSDDLQELWKEYLKEDSGKTVYRSDEDMLLNRLYAIGEFVYSLLNTIASDAPEYSLLEWVFSEQYAVEDGKIVLRDKKAIASDSLQSPDDQDAAYRHKKDQKVTGYVTNITETVEGDKPSIITSVQTKPANFGDCKFLQKAVDNTERVTGKAVKELYSDGAYQSPENREFAKDHDEMELKTGRMQGGCRFILDRRENSDELKVTDTKTGEIIEATYIG
jgi:uncharacterized FlaG/YvyC family protein